MSLAQLPLRLTTGAFVLNSGIGKLSLSDEDAEGLQQMAANGVPVLADMSPAAFRRFIAFTEIGVGAAQLIPKVPGWLAGSALSAFSAGLLNMYLNTPGMTQEDGVRPSSDGTAVAKDVWMLGAGLSVIVDSAVNTTGRRKKAAKRRVAKIHDAKDQKVEAIHSARDEQQKVLHDAAEAAREERKAARKAARSARKEAQKAA
ncbi:MAG TPA: hypothetical protein H9822_04370 [Candidatus Yaniella excrementavium]|nr:hypothetical protein [Candidatus Yaniella excrementavium]